MIRVTVWNENVHEKENPKVREVYPDGLHEAIAKGISNDDFVVRTATLDQPEHGLGGHVLDNTDVLIWWGHKAHDQVRDEIVDRVHRRILDGMGLIVLHSGHFSKIFKKLMGTSCDLKWREVGEKERIWVVDPAHPIAAGLDACLELEQEEMYGEHFDIPVPDELVMISWFEGGEVFRSGCTYHRGNGKIFYFRPGHETFPTYHNKQVLQVIRNGIRWTAQPAGARQAYGLSKPLEDLSHSQK
ncbi:trehalose utilization protein [Paenibacillus larvae subsp. larvae]|uniref:Trehalose utilization protein n=1 Tax=Paenibacillus larvae subsp. larvae TaxID=147375 RepID=A0A2L1UHJ7_9BACL|nr:ThuA domain-containing protein [Paenibacillus larvae]AQT84249.1 trehalose utilization protein ThuA [Paenibacillus larvae subsp. pulvifaciens]AQZ46226.1 trehalose utilization protein ThuA [Paenibacillus larvae subsp. pulvifaciens]AVF27898.1 trehalose utilization protein [Paenibacillus larvae subsp. larvae]AVF32400.1 trehalose utilization protein [Paenibacillus larvae subsp. larvae]MBH0341463.1 PalA [Paenibacillus larvae]